MLVKNFCFFSSACFVWFWFVCFYFIYGYILNKKLCAGRFSKINNNFKLNLIKTKSLIKTLPDSFEKKVPDDIYFINIKPPKITSWLFKMSSLQFFILCFAQTTPSRNKWPFPESFLHVLHSNINDKLLCTCFVLWPKIIQLKGRYYILSSNNFPFNSKKFFAFSFKYEFFLYFLN